MSDTNLVNRVQIVTATRGETSVIQVVYRDEKDNVFYVDGDVIDDNPHETIEQIFVRLLDSYGEYRSEDASREYIETLTREAAARTQGGS